MIHRTGEAVIVQRRHSAHLTTASRFTMNVLLLVGIGGLLLLIAGRKCPSWIVRFSPAWTPR